MIDGEFSNSIQRYTVNPSSQSVDLTLPGFFLLLSPLSSGISMFISLYFIAVDGLILYDAINMPFKFDDI